MTYEMIKRSTKQALVISFAFYCLYMILWLSLLVFVVVFSFSFFSKTYRSNLKKRQMSYSFERFLEILRSYAMIPQDFTNILKESFHEYSRVFPKDDFSVLATKVLAKIHKNNHIKDVLSYFSQEMAIEEGELFCKSLLICIQKGGNLNRTIKETIVFLKEKKELERDIEMITLEKNTERVIVSICPFAILALLGLSQNGYMEPLYQGFNGRLIMTLAGILFLLSSLIAKKLLEVKV